MKISKLDGILKGDKTYEEKKKAEQEIWWIWEQESQFLRVVRETAICMCSEITRQNVVAGGRATEGSGSAKALGREPSWGIQGASKGQCGWSQGKEVEEEEEGKEVTGVGRVSCV